MRFPSATRQILDRLPDTAGFHRASVTNRAQRAPQAAKPPGHALGASFHLQREHRHERVLCSRQVTAQGPGRGEIHPRTMLIGDKPGLFGYLAEQRQGSGGLDLGLLAVAESDERRPGGQRAAGVIEPELTADLVPKWVISGALQLIGSGVQRGAHLLPRADRCQ